MKKVTFLLLALMLFTASVFSSSTAINKTQIWRTNEMEVRLFLENTSQFEYVKELKIDGDFYNDGTAIIYVTPSELEKIDNYGLRYNILKKDLNEFSKNFWKSQADVPNGYYSFDEIAAIADSLAQNFPDICSKRIFGTTAGGLELAALKISDNVEVDENEAEVIFDGGIHGDEIGASENVIRFARKLCTEYGSYSEITDLVDSREIWLYYCVNPWGRNNMSRQNQNGVDLNRDWGYMWDQWGGSTGAFSQVESKALRKCIYENQFVVHTTYHSGTEYISLPWSYRSSQCEDFPQIEQLAGVYAETSTYPNLEYGQGATGMYFINGSSKDTNYGMMGSISWSMEISYSKQPPASEVQMYYQRNVPAMLAIIEYSGYGVEGIVTDSITGEPIQAIVLVDDYIQTYTDSTAGDFHKYVLPGTYSITIIANGYENKTIDNIVVTENSSTVTDFQMNPTEEYRQFVYKFAASQIPDNNPSDEGDTPAVFGAPDNRNYSIGKNGWVVLDMQFPVVNGPGTDIRIYEGDSSPEGYSVFVGPTFDGPWISIGTGNGTTEFDFAETDVSEAQFIKIMDDGDGTAIADNAGFDLDAIEALAHESGVYLSLSNYVIDDSASGNNNGRIDAGETVDLIVNIRNNGDISAENIAGEISSFSEYITLNTSNIDFGTLAQGEISEGIFNITADNQTPIAQGVNINLAITANSGSYQDNFELYFTVGLVIEDFETGDFSAYEWSFSGNSDWIIDNTNFYEGNYSAKSGITNHNQSSELSLSVESLGDGEIRFYKKVSSEGNYDFLKFYIDGSEIGSWSAEINWSEEVFPVDSGTHIYKWSYVKDGSVSTGSDCAWIDNIYLPITNPVSIDNNYELQITNYELFQNYPNPFNPITTIKYAIPFDQHVELSVFNLMGEKITVLVNENNTRGLHKVTFDASKFASGQYLFRLKADNFTKFKKMLLVK